MVLKSERAEVGSMEEERTVSVGTVKTEASPGRRPTKEELAQDVNAGLTDAQIGQKYGISAPAVKTCRRRHGLLRRAPPVRHPQEGSKESFAHPPTLEIIIDGLYSPGAGAMVLRKVADFLEGCPPKDYLLSVKLGLHR